MKTKKKQQNTKFGELVKIYAVRIFCGVLKIRVNIK